MLNSFLVHRVVQLYKLIYNLVKYFIAVFLTSVSKRKLKIMLKILLIYLNKFIFVPLNINLQLKLLTIYGELILYRLRLKQNQKNYLLLKVGLPSGLSLSRGKLFSLVVLAGLIRRFIASIGLI